MAIRVGSSIAINGEDYTISEVGEPGPNGKRDFTLRRESDGSMWIANGKRVAWNSSLTKVVDDAPEQAPEAPADPLPAAEPARELADAVAYGPMAREHFGHLAKWAPTEEGRAYWARKVAAL